MLIYNVNGSVTDIQINAIVDGKITSSVVTPANIPDSLTAATASATITNAIAYASSSATAYSLGYPTNLNPTNVGYTYLSSATIQKIYSTNSYSVLNPTNPNLHTRGQVNHYITSSATFLIATASFLSASLKDYAYSSVTSHSLSTTDYTDTSLVNDTTLYYYSASVVVSDSLKNLVANTAFSQSVAAGRIVKIVVPFETLKPVIEPTISNIQNITILNYNGVVQSLNTFNTISSSISDGIVSNFALLFASASKNNMGSVVNNTINLTIGKTQLKSISIKKTLASEGTEIQAFEAKYPNNDNRTNKGTVYLSSATIPKTYSTSSYSVEYPTNKSNWSTINGVLTSPKNQ